MRKLLLSLAFIATLLPAKIYAQTPKDGLYYKIGGYVQGVLEVGNRSTHPTAGDYPVDATKYFMSMGIRRGYFGGLVGYQDFAIRGEISLSNRKLDYYKMAVTYSPHQVAGLSFTLGLNTVLYGYELVTSSRLRATIERAPYFRDLFPSDVDMGLVVRYQPECGDAWWLNHVDVSAGAMSGNDRRAMRKRLPDAVLRFEIGHSDRSLSLLWGGSTYLGYVPNGVGVASPRRYFGTHFTSKVANNGGIWSTMLEAVAGRQPGSTQENNAVGSHAPKNGDATPLENRLFLGGMAMTTYRLSAAPIEFVARYTYYDRRRGATSRDLQANAETISTTHGFDVGVHGYLIDDKVRLSLFYNGEKRLQLPGEIIQPTDKTDELRHRLTMGVQIRF